MAERWSRVVGVFPEPQTGGAIVFWDLDSGQERTRIKAHDDWVSSLSLSPDGQSLASGGMDGTVRLWNLAQIH